MGPIDTDEVNVPKVSIIMLNFNGLSYLEEVVPVIKSLSYPALEYIVVDNGSTDGSLEFLRRQEGLKVVNSPRYREKNFACNYAINGAAGEFILLIDNDIIVTDSQLIYNLVDSFFEFSNTGCLSLAYVNRGEKTSKGYGNFCTLYFTKDNRKLSIEAIGRLHGSLIAYPSGIGIFMKRSMWQEVGGYDDFLKFGGDDNDLGMKLWLNGYKNYLYSRSIQIHIGMGERLDTKKYSLKFRDMVFAHLYVIVKNYTFRNAILSVPIYGAYALLKAIKQSVSRRSLSPLTAVFSGYFLFLKSILIVLKKRTSVQYNRKIKEDVFFNLP